MTGDIYSPVATRFLVEVCEAAFASQSVRDWLVACTSKAERFTGARSLHVEQARRRGAMKGPFYTNYWWGAQIVGPCRPEGSTACEIDAMLFLEAQSGNRLAVHIEHKRAKETFKFGQAEAYPMRAARFTEPKHCPRQIVLHDDWLTIVFCDDAELDDPSLAAFDRKIGHLETRRMIQASVLQGSSHEL